MLYTSAWIPRTTTLDIATEGEDLQRPAKLVTLEQPATDPCYSLMSRQKLEDRVRFLFNEASSVNINHRVTSDASINYGSDELVDVVNIL